MTLVKYNPNHKLTTYGSFIDRYFNDEAFSNKSAIFSPKVDVVESEKSFEIQFYIPGVKKDEIKIDIKDDRLTVSGERKFENENKHKSFHSVESQYGHFSRSFYLPDNIDSDKIEAKYQDGILNIEIPKDEKKSTKKSISIT